MFDARMSQGISYFRPTAYEPVTRTPRQLLPRLAELLFCLDVSRTNPENLSPFREKGPKLVTQHKLAFFSAPPIGDDRS